MMLGNARDDMGIKVLRFGAISAMKNLMAVPVFDQRFTLASAEQDRQENQRCDGAFEVSVSKVMRGDARTVVKALAGRKTRAALEAAAPEAARALWAALDAPASKGFVIRPDGLGRFRYKWGDTTVQFYMVPKAGKVSVVVTNMKLAGAADVDRRRTLWRTVLEALAAATA